MRTGTCTRAGKEQRGGGRCWWRLTRCSSLPPFASTVKRRDETYTATHHFVDSLELVDDVKTAQNTQDRDNQIRCNIECFSNAYPLPCHLRMNAIANNHIRNHTIHIEKKVYEIGDDTADNILHDRLLIQVDDVLRKVAHHMQQNTHLHSKF